MSTAQKILGGGLMAGGAMLGSGTAISLAQAHTAGYTLTFSFGLVAGGILIPAAMLVGGWHLLKDGVQTSDPDPAPN